MSAEVSASPADSGRSPLDKVRALQHLLTHSFSGRALAVRRVTENPGKVHSQRLTVVKPRPAKGRKRGLSCLRGNSPEQFLGG